MRHSKELKEKVVQEITEVGNISLVCKRYGLNPSTVHSWLNNIKHKDRKAENKEHRSLQKKLKEQEHEILVLRALLKKTYPLWNNDKPLS